MKKIVLILSLIFSISKFQAQDASDILGSWYMFNGSHLLSEKIALKTAVHFRYFELVDEYQQEIYRLGLNYKIGKTIDFTLGSVYSITDTSYKEDASDLFEYRLYQDLVAKDKWDDFSIKHRIRLAQRFKRQNFENTTAHRVRYGLFLNYPISENLTTYGFNEVFIRFADQTFGQNRLGAGFLQKIGNQLKLKLGYMYTKFSETKSHRLQLGVVLNTNHLKNTI